MAGSIKGIMIEIGGDTSGLQNALKKVNSSSSSLSRELRGINSLLKLDPKNTELVSQKQAVLAENIKQTEDKLKMLKETKEKADKAMAEGTEINEENYRSLQREIINTENKLKQMKVESSNWTKIGNEIDNVGTKITGIGDKVGNLGTTLTKTLTPAVIGLTTLAIKSFDEVDTGMDIIIKKTGATADVAVDLEKTYKKVAGEVSGSFEDTGNAIGEINTRFGFTGEILEKASEQFLKFAKVNDVDVNESVQKVSRYMGDASIESNKYGEVLDNLTSVAQASGISIGTLTEYLTKYGAPMRALGLDTQESIAIFAGWEKAGVNTEIAFSGMKKAIGTWGKEGKDATKEFKKTLEEIKKCPDIASATTKAIEVFGQKAGPDLADAIKGGRFEYSEFLDILKKSNGVLDETYTNIIDETDEAEISMKKLKIEFGDIGKEILKTTYPAVEDILKVIKDLIAKFNKLDPQLKKNIIKYTGLAAAMGPVVKTGGKLISTTGNIVSSIGKLVVETGKAKQGLETAGGATGIFAKGLASLTTPIGATIAGVTLATGIIIAEVEKAKKETESKFKAMSDGVNSFFEGIQNAEGYLDSFNTTLFATTEEQEELQKQMDEIQEGITQICKTASDERRGYTQEEITQLDEYFEKLRELKNREIEIEQLRANAVKQQAVTIAETNKGSLAEYQEISSQWIATTQQQTDAVISRIESATVEEIALLNQRYGTEANMQNKAYADEYNRLMDQKEEKIKIANKEMAEVTSAFAEGYSIRLSQEDGYLITVQEYTNKQQKLLEGHNEQIRKIKDGELWYVTNTAQAINSENETFTFHQKELYKEMYKNMSEEQGKELGVWLARLSQTELYGGEISKENQEMVDTIIDSYDEMPDEAKKAMTDTMSGMLKGMEDEQPTLFAKATGIADGILSRLKKSFDIHSPSKETRDIFQNVMKGAELGLEDEERKLNKQVDTIANQMKTNFANIMPNMGAIKQSVIDKTRTVFTTPNITFNVQKMDEANLNTAFNYVNRRLGSQY